MFFTQVEFLNLCANNSIFLCSILRSSSFAFALHLCCGFVSYLTGRISNVIQEALADKLLAGKWQTLNACTYRNKQRLKEEGCQWKRMGAVGFNCSCVNAACAW